MAATPDGAPHDADAPIISVSTDAHADLVRAAIERELPAFCEKLLAASLADPTAISADIEASGLLHVAPGVDRPDRPLSRGRFGRGRHDS